jgi:hypothetical protein
VRTRAHVDTLTLNAPSVLGVGHTAKITATVTQGAHRVPVAFPLAADWTGSPNVHIGDRDSARHRHTVVFEPSTGTLTALRPGTITLAVTVNGTTQLTRIRIASEGTASAARRNTRTTRRSRTRFHVPGSGPVLPVPYSLR